MRRGEPNVRKTARIRHDDGPRRVDVGRHETGYNVREGAIDVVDREDGGAGWVRGFVAEEEEVELVFWEGLADGQVGAVEWGACVSDDEVNG